MRSKSGLSSLAAMWYTCTGTTRPRASSTTNWTATVLRHLETTLTVKHLPCDRRQLSCHSRVPSTVSPAHPSPVAHRARPHPNPSAQARPATSWKSASQVRGPSCACGPRPARRGRLRARGPARASGARARAGGAGRASAATRPGPSQSAAGQSPYLGRVRGGGETARPNSRACFLITDRKSVV